METEKSIERYLRDQIAKLGGEAYKFVSPGRKFVIDRICVLPRGIVVFVEVKGPNGKLHPGQFRELKRLQAKGHEACCIASRLEVDRLINTLREEINERTANSK